MVGDVLTKKGCEGFEFLAGGRQHREDLYYTTAAKKIDLTQPRTGRSRGYYKHRVETARTEHRGAGRRPGQSTPNLLLATRSTEKKGGCKSSRIRARERPSRPRFSGSIGDGRRAIELIMMSDHT
jgi:hypothetical protein